MFDFFAEKFSSIIGRLGSKSTLDEKSIDDALESIKDALLSADVPYELVESFAGNVRSQLIGQKAIASVKPSEQLTKVVYEQMVAFLGGDNTPGFTPQIPSIIMVMGLQGAGKTTTIGKLSAYFKKLAKRKGKERRILVASVDYYRPAAIAQLEQVARQAGVNFFKAESSDPIKAAQEISAYAQANRYELLLLDTAGRMHVDNAMLQELRVIDAELKPKHKILVLDAMTGQESLAVAKAFDSGVGFQGAILSKSDSDSRGGAAFSFRYALKKPILFVGSGEKMADLDLFYPERAASRMLGMGDVQSLVEQVNDKIKQSDQDRMYSSWDKGSLTLEDFAQQMDMVNKLGPLSSVLKYLPGMGGMKLPEGALEQGQAEMKRFRAIINSMTFKERVYTRILNDSRKARIAKGAGVAVSEVDKLLSRFVNMQQYAKLIKKSGGLRNVFK